MKYSRFYLTLWMTTIFGACTFGSGASSDVKVKTKDNRSFQHRSTVTKASNSAHGQNVVTGRAVKIVDGDTFDLLIGEKIKERIRLHGIDCPEKKQDFYQVAKNYLSGLLAGKTVRVVRKDKDRWGRTIGMVFVDDSNVNESMLRAGMAWHYTKYDQNPVWASLQEKAVQEQRGLWSHPHPIAPWIWRKR